MNKDTEIKIRVEKKLKTQFVKAAKSMYMSLSDWLIQAGLEKMKSEIK